MASHPYTKHHCVIVRGIPPSCDNKNLEAYFGRKKNGGCGDVEYVQYPISPEEGDAALVLFGNTDTVTSIKRFPHTSLGPYVTVETPKTPFMMMSGKLDKDLIRKGSTHWDHLRETLKLQVKEDEAGDFHIKGTKWQIQAAEEYLESSPVRTGKTSPEDAMEETAVVAAVAVDQPVALNTVELQLPDTDSDVIGEAARTDGDDAVALPESQDAVAGQLTSEPASLIHSVESTDNAEGGERIVDQGPEVVDPNKFDSGTANASSSAPDAPDDNSELSQVMPDDKEGQTGKQDTQLRFDARDNDASVGVGTSSFTVKEQTQLQLATSDADAEAATQGAEAVVPSATDKTGAIDECSVNSGDIRSRKEDVVISSVSSQRKEGAARTSAGDTVDKSKSADQLKGSPAENQLKHDIVRGLDTLVIDFMKKYTDVGAKLESFIDSGKVTEEDCRKEGTQNFIFSSSVPSKFRQEMHAQYHGLLNHTREAELTLGTLDETDVRMVISEALPAVKHDEGGFVYILKGNRLRVRAPESVIFQLCSLVKAAVRKGRAGEEASHGSSKEYREMQTSASRVTAEDDHLSLQSHKKSDQLPETSPKWIGVTMHKTEYQLLSFHDLQLWGEIQRLLKGLQAEITESINGGVNLKLRNTVRDRQVLISKVEGILRVVRDKSELLQVPLGTHDTVEKRKLESFCEEQTRNGVYFAFSRISVTGQQDKLILRVEKEKISSWRHAMAKVISLPTAVSVSTTKQPSAGEVTVSSTAASQAAGRQGTVVASPSGTTSAAKQYMQDRMSDPSTVSGRFGSGPKIYVYQADITKLAVDAIVSASNSYLDNKVGVAKALSEAAGPELDAACAKSRVKHGYLKPGCVRKTKAGNLLSQVVIHAHGPVKGVGSQAEQEGQLSGVILKAVESANKSGFTSMAIPAIGTGTTSMPLDVATMNIIYPIIKYGKDTSSGLSLKEVHVADIRPEVVRALSKTLTDLQSLPRLFSSSAQASSPRLSHGTETVNVSNPGAGAMGSRSSLHQAGSTPGMASGYPTYAQRTAASAGYTSTPATYVGSGYTASSNSSLGARTAAGQAGTGHHATSYLSKTASSSYLPAEQSTPMSTTFSATDPSYATRTVVHQPVSSTTVHVHVVQKTGAENTSFSWQSPSMPTAPKASTGNSVFHPTPRASGSHSSVGELSKW